MGLKKRYKSIDGKNVNYWSIGFLRIDRKRKLVDCKMWGYASKKDAEANVNPLSIKSVRLIEDEYDDFNSATVIDKKNPFEIMYSHAKEKDKFFKDSVDDI